MSFNDGTLTGGGFTDVSGVTYNGGSASFETFGDNAMILTRPEGAADSGSIILIVPGLPNLDSGVWDWPSTPITPTPTPTIPAASATPAVTPTPTVTPTGTPSGLNPLDYLTAWTGSTGAGGSRWQGDSWSPSGSGIAVAVSWAPSGTSKAMYSTDSGSTWTTATTVNRNWFDCVWSPTLNIFCAVATVSTNPIMTSPNGVTWTQQTAPNAGTAWNGITWGSGSFVVVGRGNPDVMTSTNGTSWTTQTRALPSASWVSVAYNPTASVFCAVADGTIGGVAGTQKVMTSPDGVSWTVQTTPTASIWRDIVWSSELGKFCAVGSDGVSSGLVGLSTDGVTWTMTSTTASMTAIAWSPEMGVFCGIATKKIYASTDGISWADKSAGIPTPLNTDYLGIGWSTGWRRFFVTGTDDGGGGTYKVMLSQPFP